MPQADHDEVATDAMERYRNKSSQGRIMPIVIGLAIALVAVAGLLLLEKNKENTLESSNAVATSESGVSDADAVDSQAATEGSLDSDSVMVKNAEEVSTYASEEWGFSFDYPASWGGVEADDYPPSEEGQALSGTFENMGNINFAAGTPDYAVYGRDYACATANVFVGATDMSNMELKEEDYTTTSENPHEKDDSYRIINTVEYSSSSTAINRHYEAGFVQGPGQCLGLSSTAMVLDVDNVSKAPLVSFSYVERESGSFSIPASWADEYLENPSFYYNEIEFNNYVNMVKSMKF